MRVEIDEVRATKTRDIHKVRFENKNDYNGIHKVRFENKNDYNKAKWMLSRLPVTYEVNDFTHTLYFLGKKF